MLTTDPQRVAGIRAVIDEFLKKRLDDKLGKLAEDDPKSSELIDQFARSNWLNHAAERVRQIQVVTHSLKPIHPEAKGSNLYVPPTSMFAQAVISSHCLGEDYAYDVVGNAAALDVYKFLNLTYQGRTLLDLVLVNDADLAAACSEDRSQAEAWLEAFASITQPRGKTASHNQAKQLYWLVGNNPHQDADFHLLAPLYASSLAQRVFETINDHRFGEAAKDARQARRDGVFSERAVHEYPELVVQKLGGTKPQNISQLNSERGGSNYLLASVPPQWHSVDVKPLLGTDSLFSIYGRRQEVRRVVKVLSALLRSDPSNNLQTREYRNELVNSLIDELLQFAAEVRNLPPGWSDSPNCRLSLVQRHWLDPEGVAHKAEQIGQTAPLNTIELMCEAFARWLNAQFHDLLPMGDPEYFHWRKLALEQLEAEVREVSHAD